MSGTRGFFARLHGGLGPLDEKSRARCKMRQNEVIARGEK